MRRRNHRRPVRPATREALAPERLVIDQGGTRLQLFGAHDDCATNTFRSVLLTLE